MLSVIIAVSAVLLVLFAWGFTRIRRRASDAAALITGVRADQIPTLVDECIRTFANRLDTRLDLNSLDTSIAGLEKHVNRSAFLAMEGAFETPEHPGWAVLPVGAFVGALIERHLGGRWIPAQGGGLAMQIGTAATNITLHPFDKISKQKWTGDPGDLTAWFDVLKQGPEAMVGRLRSAEAS